MGVGAERGGRAFWAEAANSVWAQRRMRESGSLGLEGRDARDGFICIFHPCNSCGEEKKKNNNKTSVFQAGKIPRVESLKREEKK